MKTAVWNWFMNLSQDQKKIFLAMFGKKGMKKNADWKQFEDFVEEKAAGDWSSVYDTAAIVAGKAGWPEIDPQPKKKKEKKGSDKPKKDSDKTGDKSSGKDDKPSKDKKGKNKDKKKGSSKGDSKESPPEKEQKRTNWQLVTAILVILLVVAAFWPRPEKVVEVARDVVVTATPLPVVEEPAAEEVAPEPEAMVEEPVEASSTSSSPVIEEDNPVFYSELTDREVQEITGVHVARVSTEPSTWTWRGYPDYTTEIVCPTGFICTLHLENNQKVVTQGNGASYTVYAATIRNVEGFEAEGESIDPCLIYSKEYENGMIADPRFLVEYLQTSGAPACVTK